MVSLMQMAKCCVIKRSKMTRIDILRTTNRKRAFRFTRIFLLFTKWSKESVSDKNMTSRRSEEHTSELQSRIDLVCRLLLEKKKQGADNRYYRGGTGTMRLAAR